MPTYTLPNKSYVDSQDALKMTTSEYLTAVGNISKPIFYMPLDNGIDIARGVGEATFTRASTATYIDRYGVLKTAAIDEPRFEKEGYLNEGASTNFILNSDDCSTRASTQWSVTTESVTTPYGTTLSVLKATSTAPGQVIRFGDLVSGTLGTIYTGSVWLKSNVATTVNMDVNNSTKVLTPITTEFNRYSVSGSDAVNPYRFFDIESTASGQVVYFFGSQLEALPFATSYIPTGASTVTRSADVLNVTRAGNMPNAQSNSDGFTVAYDMNSVDTNTSNSKYAWSLYSSGSDFIGSSQYGATAIRHSMANSIGSVINTFPTSDFTKKRVITTASNTELKLYVDGVLRDTDTNTTGIITNSANGLSSVRIGGLGVSGTSSNFNGHISNVRIWDKALTAQEVALA